MPIIHILCLAICDARTEFDDTYVVCYDPTRRLPDGSYDGGILEVTIDPEKALVLPTVEAAFELWRKEGCGVRSWDGKPNRPLTAWTVEIMPEPGTATSSAEPSAVDQNERR